jgi:hypothetical protein
MQAEIINSGPLCACAPKRDCGTLYKKKSGIEPQRLDPQHFPRELIEDALGFEGTIKVLVPSVISADDQVANTIILADQCVAQCLPWARVPHRCWKSREQHTLF